MAKMKGKDKPDTKIYFNRAMKVITKVGYIKKTILLKIFKGMNAPTIIKAFDRYGEPIYKETIKVQYYNKGKKKGFHNVVVYKLLNPVFEQYRQERRIVGSYNNSYQGNMTGRLY